MAAMAAIVGVIAGLPAPWGDGWLWAAGAPGLEGSKNNLGPPAAMAAVRVAELAYVDCSNKKSSLMWL